MEAIGSISKLLLVLLLTKAFRCIHSNSDEFDFQQMVNNSQISIPDSEKNYYYPGIILEISENVAIYKSKDAEESIKVLYPIQKERKSFFLNEINILKKLNSKFADPVENGIVKLIACGQALWSYKDYELYDQMKLVVRCTAIVYTYGKPLFPILKQCVQNDDRKMLFWIFARMATSMESMTFVGNTLHNNIGPSVFRVTIDGKVVVDNFEIARSVRNSKSDLIYTKDDFPIGFKSTMSRWAMCAKKRLRECQQHSFEMTSYNIMHKRLPWQMDAIDFLWNFNTTEARQLTFKLQKIDLANYFMLDLSHPIHSEIFSVIKTHGMCYKNMSEEFLRMSEECPWTYNIE